MRLDEQQFFFTKFVAAGLDSMSCRQAVETAWLAQFKRLHAVGLTTSYLSQRMWRLDSTACHVGRLL